MEEFIRECDFILAALDEISVKGEENHRYMLLATQKLHGMRDVMKSRMIEEAKRNAAENKQGE